MQDSLRRGYKKAICFTPRLVVQLVALRFWGCMGAPLCLHGRCFGGDDLADESPSTMPDVGSAIIGGLPLANRRINRRYFSLVPISLSSS